ncbi:MAG: integrin alpha [Myxococcota bacterium]
MIWLAACVPPAEPPKGADEPVELGPDDAIGTVTGSAGTRFGQALAADAATLVVGEPLYGDDERGAFRVFAGPLDADFVADDGALVEGDAPGLRLGVAVALVEGVVVAGAEGGAGEVWVGDARWTGEADGDLAGRAVASAGDRDGDGATDVFVGAPGAADERGAAYVLHGGDGGSLADADEVWLGAEGSNAGWAGCAPGDVDGDGYDDLVISQLNAWSPDEASGTAHLLPGGVAGAHEIATEDEAAWSSGEPGLLQAGYALACPGDVDGDDVPDVAIGAYDGGDASDHRGRAWLTPAGARGSVVLAEAATWTFTGEPRGNAGAALAGLAVGMPGEYDETEGVQAVAVLSADSAGPYTLADAPVRITGGPEVRNLGYALAWMGEELVVSAPDGEESGVVLVFR